MNRINHEVIKAELFEGITELSASSKKKLNLIIGVQSDAERTIVRMVIKTEVQKVLRATEVIKNSQEVIKNNQEAMAREIADIKIVVGGVNGKS